MIHFLCKYPDYQDECRREITETFGKTHDITPENVDKLTFVKQMIHESLRMYPPVYEVDKEALEDTTIQGLFIPKGSMIGLNIYGLHNNPDVWENPHQFDPTRWTEDRLKKVPHYRQSYIPFSLGSRDCIGKLFSLTEAPLIIAKVLQNFSIELSDPTIPLKTYITISTKPIPYKIKLVKK